MSYFRKFFERLRRSQEGATAVEYGVMVALIAAVIVAIVLLLGRQVREGFCSTADAVAKADSGTTYLAEADVQNAGDPDTDCANDGFGNS